jgi:hypothetical protein
MSSESAAAKPEQPDRKKRRKDARALVTLLLRRVKEGCAAIGRADDIVDRMDDVLKDIERFLGAADAREFVPDGLRQDLGNAVSEFRAAKARLDKIDQACSRLKTTLNAVQKVLGVGWTIPWPAAAAGVAVAGIIVVVVVAAVAAGESGNDNNSASPSPRVNGPTATLGGETIALPTTDLRPITDPQDASSPSHEIDAPSSDPIIVINWSLVPDAQAFSVDWTPNDQGVPDTEPDLPGDATEARSEPLSDGAWYFNLRTQGANGDWTSTLHLGPFLIDTSAECPDLRNLALTLSDPDLQNHVILSWESAGGCEPYAGSLTATYQGEQEPYATYPVENQSGQLVDQPPARCEGTFEVLYSITLTDDAGQTVEAIANTEVSWIC